MMNRTELTMEQMEAVVGGSVNMSGFKKTPKSKAEENKTADKTGKVGNIVSQIWSQAKFLTSMALDWITD